MRSTSWLLAAKCLTVAITPWLCTPRMWATAMWLASVGSSPKYSKLRPLRAVRVMLTPGPSSTLRPWPLTSRAMAVPTRSTSAGSKLAASRVAAGKAVAVPTRTPMGPSVMRRAGMCKRGSPAVSKPVPATNPSFSSRVMPASQASTCRSSCETFANLLIPVRAGLGAAFWTGRLDAHADMRTTPMVMDTVENRNELTSLCISTSLGAR